MQKLKDGDLIHDYRLCRKIGEGSMGTVFLSQKGKEELPYALKFAYGSPDSAEVKALLNEASILKEIKDGRFPEFYEVFQEEEYACLVMEYIHGETLEEILRKNTLSYVEKIKLMQEIADLMWQLHSHRPQIIYRDLKPVNMLREPNGMIRLIDFGSAMFFNDSILEKDSTMIAGTYGYAAPEQRMGKVADARSDVYALGAICSYIFTGVDPGLPPFSILLETSKEINEIIQRATEEEAMKRYQNAGDFLIDIMKVKNTEEEKGKRFLKWLSKKRRENRYIKNREWNVLRSEKKSLGLW